MYTHSYFLTYWNLQQPHLNSWKLPASDLFFHNPSLLPNLLPSQWSGSPFCPRLISLPMSWLPPSHPLSLLLDVSFQCRRWQTSLSISTPPSCTVSALLLLASIAEPKFYQGFIFCCFVFREGAVLWSVDSGVWLGIYCTPTHLANNWSSAEHSDTILNIENERRFPGWYWKSFFTSQRDRKHFPSPFKILLLVIALWGFNAWSCCNHLIIQGDKPEDKLQMVKMTKQKDEKTCILDIILLN